jgi:mannose-6-phosphate isomerase-like protein (cupin superfamily)
MTTDRTTNEATQPRGAAKKEAFHRNAEAQIVPFQFQRPDADLGDDRTVCYLAHSDLIEASVQVFPKGGGNVLHYHPGPDGFWMVLRGRMRFYGPDGLIGEYGPNEGIVMPRNARYWFESADENEEAHLLHLNCESQDNVQNRSVTLGARDPDRKKNRHFGFPPGRRASG